MLTWTYDELAGILQRPDGRFDHHRLTREYGFPKPLPGFRDPLIWSRHAVAAWVKRAGGLIDTVGPMTVDDEMQLIIAGDSAHLDRILSGGVTA